MALHSQSWHKLKNMFLTWAPPPQWSRWHPRPKLGTPTSHCQQTEPSAQPRQRTSCGRSCLQLFRRNTLQLKTLKQFGLILQFNNKDANSKTLTMEVLHQYNCLVDTILPFFPGVYRFSHPSPAPNLVLLFLPGISQTSLYESHQYIIPRLSSCQILYETYSSHTTVTLY